MQSRVGLHECAARASILWAFFTLWGISSTNTGQETVGCAVSCVLIMQERKRALVCLSVQDLSFYVHFGVHAVVFGRSCCLHLHGTQEYPDTPQSFVCAQQQLLPCQSLPKNLLFQLLGLSIAILSTVTHYGLHFTLISNISLESNSYRVIHYAGMSRSHPTETFGEPRSCKIPQSSQRKCRGITGGGRGCLLEDALGLMQSHRHLFLCQTCLPGTEGCYGSTECLGAAAFAPVPLFTISPSYPCAAVKAWGRG